MLVRISYDGMQVATAKAPTKQTYFASKFIWYLRGEKIDGTSRRVRTILYLTASFQDFNPLHTAYGGEVICRRSSIWRRCHQHAIFHDGNF